MRKKFCSFNQNKAQINYIKEVDQILFKKKMIKQGGNKLKKKKHKIYINDYEGKLLILRRRIQS